MVTSVWKIKTIAVLSKSYRVITCWNNDICLIKARGLEASVSSLEDNSAPQTSLLQV